MVYESGKAKHGLARDPFKSCVVPRPIVWTSTVNKSGVRNLAPLRQFQNVSYDPPYVGVLPTVVPPEVIWTG